jgi:predicted hotdog family 3-hydroxylacyl-ACP dehydratase
MIQDLIDHRQAAIDPQARETIAAWAAAQYLRTTAVHQVGDDLTNFVFELAIATDGRLTTPREGRCHSSPVGTQAGLR